MYHDKDLGSSISIMEKDPATGYVLFATSSAGAPPTTANKFAPGAIVVDTLNGLAYINRGTAAAPAWISQPGKYFSVAIDTNGTSAVNVFSAAGAPCALKVTSVISIAKDTTTGNITLSQAANTVATIAKGATAGVPVGASTMSNQTYAAGDICQVLSSSAGNSTVLMTFQLV